MEGSELDILIRELFPDAKHESIPTTASNSSSTNVIDWFIHVWRLFTIPLTTGRNIFYIKPVIKRVGEIDQEMKLRCYVWNITQSNNTIPVVISFEELFEACTPEIQQKLLFHLDLFE